MNSDFAAFTSQMAFTIQNPAFADCTYHMTQPSKIRLLLYAILLLVWQVACCGALVLLLLHCPWLSILQNCFISVLTSHVV